MTRTAVLPLLAAVALLLAGCAPTVSLTPAPRATTVGCAKVAVRLPQSIQGLARRTTDAQGTAAWGPDPAITLVCGGVRQPSSECGTVRGIDWTQADARDRAGRPVTIRTTFGRDPVVQVVKPGSGAAGRLVAVDVLTDISDAVRAGTRSTGERCGG